MNSMVNYLTLQWHITEQCDQRCKHCYIFRGNDKKIRTDISEDDCKSIFLNFTDCCKKLNCLPYFVITGGDPILSDNFWFILNLLKCNNIPFSILGNPFHLDEEIIKKLEQYGCISYQMSIDGLENTHDFFRKTGSYKKTIEAIRLFKNSPIKVSIMSTVSKANFLELPKLVELLVKENVDTYSFARYCPSLGEIQSMISPEEYRQFLETMWAKYIEFKESKTEFLLKDHLWKLFLYEKGLFKIDKSNDLIVDGCHCGISHITCLSDGSVYACRRSDTLVGNCFDSSFYNLFLGKEFEQYRNFDKFEHCCKCNLKCYCRGCPSVSNSLYGDFYAKDPQCWKK